MCNYIKKLSFTLFSQVWHRYASWTTSFIIRLVLISTISFAPIIYIWPFLQTKDIFDSRQTAKPFFPLFITQFFLISTVRNKNFIYHQGKCLFNIHLVLHRYTLLQQFNIFQVKLYLLHWKNSASYMCLHIVPCNFLLSWFVKESVQ